MENYDTTIRLQIGIYHNSPLSRLCMRQSVLLFVWSCLLLLHALQVAAVASVNLYEVALVDEQRYANFNASLESSRLGSVCSCVALDRKSVV